MVRNITSAQTIKTTPITKTHKVSIERLGKIRSYTFIVKIGIASANKLIKNAASMMSR